MQWNRSLALFAALLIGSAGAVQAEMHEGEHGGGTSKFQEYDKDGDGKISMEEAQSAESQKLSENFEQYDENGNQELDQGEFARFEAEETQEGGGMQEEDGGMEEGGGGGM
ncbi:hypothetical protein [Thiohalorhabdus methylotrophus]|uniref:EF-hand domain-containing protein n=1 Tax=Thiohalorhabdus methylotrophus TaxID=3242694 RepID=A0ABV4TSG0_9GAMM